MTPVMDFFGAFYPLYFGNLDLPVFFFSARFGAYLQSTSVNYILGCKQPGLSAQRKPQKRLIAGFLPWDEGIKYCAKAYDPRTINIKTPGADSS
jgi:hypothetical protein